MLFPLPAGERFSESAARRVVGLLALNKKCSVSFICTETSLSKVTVGRIISHLRTHHIVREYSYRKFGGRGRRAAEYYLSPKISSAVADLRSGKMSLHIYSLPGMHEKTVVPRVFCYRPMSDKESLLRNECLERLAKEVPEKYLFSLSVLADGECVSFPGAFLFREAELDAENLRGRTLLICRTETRRSVTLADGGKVVFEAALPEGNAADSVIEAANALSDLEPERVAVISPHLSSEDRRNIASALPVEVVFPGATFDERRFAVLKTVGALTGSGKQVLF